MRSTAILPAVAMSASTAAAVASADMAEDDVMRLTKSATTCVRVRQRDRVREKER